MLLTGRSRRGAKLFFWEEQFSMKITLMAIAFACFGLIGCSPTKSRACDGCEGTLLRDCERAYEACDSMKHCRYTDIRRDYSKKMCLEGE
jgi:hypothetical protein